jgi:hypothetical protein
MKKSAKVLLNHYFAPVWETPNRPPNLKVPAFLGDQFIKKKWRSDEEVRGLEVFMY